jgi:nucleotide-binding universal stress UspA family protein
MFKTILVASDGSETADRLVTVAESLAKGDGAKVVVAHVNELMAGRGAIYSVHPNEDLLQRKVRLQVGDLQAAGLDAECKILSTRGRAADSIAEVARDCNADLIVTAGSNLGPSNPLLLENTKAAVAAYNAAGVSAPVPIDLVTSDFTGFDPDISEAAALAQVNMVATARGLNAAKVTALVESQVQGRILWVFGEPVVNVLQLNLALDAQQSSLGG